MSLQKLFVDIHDVGFADKTYVRRPQIIYQQRRNFKNGF